MKAENTVLPGAQCSGLGWVHAPIQDPAIQHNIIRSWAPKNVLKVGR